MYRRGARRWAKHLDFILLDALCLQVVLLIAYSLRHGFDRSIYQLPLYRTLAITYFGVDLLVAIVFNTMHNVLKRGRWQELVQSVKHVVLVLFTMALYMFVVQTGDYYSRLTVLYTAIGHLGLGVLVRMLWKRILAVRGVGRGSPTMVLVAEEAAVPGMVRDAATSGISFAGLVLIDRDATGEQVSGLPVIADIHNAADYLKREWVDEIYVCPRGFDDLKLASEDGDMAEADGYPSPVADLIELCTLMALPVHIRLPLGQIRSKGFAEKVAGHTVLTFTSNYASGLQLALKRLLDIVGGLVGSLIALIIIVVVGPFIKHASPGPILFKQERIGLNGKRFRMYKLRSMYLDAEERKAELLEQNRVEDGMMFKLDWDPRIIGNRIVDGERRTGIGEFVRRTSLDEFPQFFNVLKGDMSLVGTRPPTVDEWEKYQYHHRARITTKPGITGMWQVSGRSEITDFEEVVRLDLEYIENWSLGLDIKILFKTLKVVFAGRGAM